MSLDDERKIWDTIAVDRGEKLTAFLEQQYVALLDTTRVGKGTRFLDCGCGNGAASALAAARGAVVTGLDNSENMLALARKRVPGGEFIHGQMDRMPMTDSSYDAVIACMSLHFADSPVDALREMGRLCAPGGRIGVICPCNLDDSDMAELVANAYTLVWPRRPTDLFRVAGPGVLERLIEDADLEIVARQKVLLTLTFPSAEAAWPVIRTFGSIGAIIAETGDEPVRKVTMRLLPKFERAGGVIRLDVWQPYFTATPKGK